MADIEFDVPAMEIEIPAMEVELPEPDLVVELPSPSDSIFLCSEGGDICRHACCGQDHKILWHNSTFLENDSDVEDEKETSSNSITDIIETFQRRTSNLGNLTTELLYAAQSDFEEALTDAIVENFMREYGLDSDDEGDQEGEEDEDEEMGDYGEGETSQLEAEVIDRILANCVSESSSDDDDDDMFLSPPAVRRRIGSFRAFTEDSVEDDEET